MHVFARDTSFYTLEFERTLGASGEHIIVSYLESVFSLARFRHCDW